MRLALICASLAVILLGCEYDAPPETEENIEEIDSRIGSFPVGSYKNSGAAMCHLFQGASYQGSSVMEMPVPVMCNTQPYIELGTPLPDEVHLHHEDRDDDPVVPLDSMEEEESSNWI